MTALFQDFLKEDRGATAIEYALLALLLGLAVFGSTGAFAVNMGAMLDKIVNDLSTVFSN